MEIQVTENGNGTLTFEAVNETTTKAIVTRNGKVIEITLRHATSEDIKRFKAKKEAIEKESVIKKEVSV